MISRIHFFYLFLFPGILHLNNLFFPPAPFPNASPVSAISLSLCLLTVFFSVITTITTSRAGEGVKKTRKKGRKSDRDAKQE